MKTGFGLFLTFGVALRPDIAYDGSPKCFSTCGSGYRSCIINQICIMCINCAKKSKKLGFPRGFCHFLNFGDSDWLDIAYDGSPKRFSTCGSGFRSCTINQLCTMCKNCAKKCKKWGFWSFSRLRWLESTLLDGLHDLLVDIVIDAPHHLVSLTDHEWLIDCT